MAIQLLADVDLRAPRIGIFPLPPHESAESTGVVGWNTWLWVKDPTPNTWGPVKASTAVAGHTVSISAKAARVEWDMGDGHKKKCGKGTPWPTYATTNQRSPDCNYVYQRDGHYRITATTHWEVTWRGIGQSGTLHTTTTASVPYTVAEIQVVSVNKNR